MDFGINGGPRPPSSSSPPHSPTHTEGWLTDNTGAPQNESIHKLWESSNKVSWEKHYFSINQLMFLYY